MSGSPLVALEVTLDMLDVEVALDTSKSYRPYIHSVYRPYIVHTTGRVAQWSQRSALVPKVLGSNPAFSTKHVTCLLMVLE